MVIPPVSVCPEVDKTYKNRSETGAVSFYSMRI